MSMFNNDLYMDMMSGCLEEAFPTAKVLKANASSLSIEFTIAERNLYGQLQQISYFENEAYLVTVIEKDDPNASNIVNTQVSNVASDCLVALNQLKEKLNEPSIDLDSDIGQLIVQPQMELKAELKKMKPLEIVDAYRLADQLGCLKFSELMEILPNDVYCNTDLQQDPKLQHVVANQAEVYRSYADELLYQYHNDNFFDAIPLTAGQLLNLLEDVPDFEDVVTTKRVDYKSTQALKHPANQSSNSETLPYELPF